MAIGVALAMVLAACSGSDDASGLTLEQIQEKLQDSGIECQGEITEPTEEENRDAFGIELSRQLECTVDKSLIAAGTFPDQATREEAAELIQGFGCSFGGQDFTFVAAGNWMIVATLPDAEGDGDTDVEMTQRVGDALGVEPTVLECDEEAPSIDDISVGDDAIGGDSTEPVPFGGTFTWDDDVSVTIGEPSAFTPDEFYEVEGVSDYVVFDVELTNGTDENFDPSSFSVNVQSGTTEASQVYDTDQLGQSPTTTLLPGRSATFKVAFGVADPDDLVMEVSPTFGFDYDSAVFTNT